MSMDPYLVLVYIHILLFVYWLGGDLGVYIASGYVANRKLPIDERFRFLALLQACDMGPRTSLILFIPVGLEMARILGVIELSPAVLGPVSLLALIWLAANWWMFLNPQHPKAPLLRDLDLKIRFAVIPLIALLAIYSLATGGPVTAPWLRVKLLIFSVVISLGVYLRSELKNWIIGFGMLRQGGEVAEKGNTMIEQSLGRSRKAALVLWTGVALAAFLGKVKPF